MSDVVCSWQMHAHRTGNGMLRDIGHQRWVELFGGDDPIVPVTVDELRVSDTKDPDVTHYGWWDIAGSMQKESTEPVMIFPRVGGPQRPDIDPWTLLGMCFTYGMQAEINRGKGRMVCLRITESEEHGHG